MPVQHRPESRSFSEDSEARVAETKVARWLQKRRQDARRGQLKPSVKESLDAVSLMRK